MKDIITGAEAIDAFLGISRSKYSFRLSRWFYHAGTFDALYDHKDTLNHILVRHEQGAAHAAQGYARVSGDVGVCLVTSRTRSDKYHHRHCRCYD